MTARNTSAGSTGGASEQRFDELSDGFVAPENEADAAAWQRVAAALDKIAAAEHLTAEKDRRTQQVPPGEADSEAVCDPAAEKNAQAPI